MMRATHTISAVYFVASKEVELTVEDIETGKKVHLTVSVDDETGEAIADIVPACVYVGAVCDNLDKARGEEK